MAYLTLLTPAVVLVGTLLMEHLERWALVPLDGPRVPEQDRATGTPRG
jgi:hypothetical protein